MFRYSMDMKNLLGATMMIFYFLDLECFISGIKDAVYIFTKVLVPHKTFLRSLGIRNSIFIDYQSVLAQGFKHAMAHTQITLAKAGWVVNLKK